MDTQEKEDALNKYDRRETFWTEQSLQQLGYSLNFFLTIGIAFLGYLITIRNDYPKFKFIWGGSVEWRLLFYYLILIIVFASVIVGTISILIRLYDLRITRHITSARKKTAKIYSEYLPEGYVDLSNESFFKTVFRKIHFIHFTTQKLYIDVSVEFERLRKQAKVLGNSTWKTHYWQIGLFLFAIIMFGISIL